MQSTPTLGTHKALVKNLMVGRYTLQLGWDHWTARGNWQNRQTIRDNTKQNNLIGGWRTWNEQLFLISFTFNKNLNPKIPFNLTTVRFKGPRVALYSRCKWLKVISERDGIRRVKFADPWRQEIWVKHAYSGKLMVRELREKFYCRGPVLRY